MPVQAYILILFYINIFIFLKIKPGSLCAACCRVLGCVFQMPDVNQIKININIGFIYRTFM